MDYNFIYYGLTLIALAITLIAQGFVTSTYKKYSKVLNRRGIKGSEVARIILDKNGLKNVDVTCVDGFLTDHYDPRSKVVRLSRDIYSGSSVASISVAAHEVGHAIQDKDGYSFMRIRASLVPIVNFSSYAGYISILLGCIFGLADLIIVGILFEVAILLFQLVTLPVEIDASRRALNEIEKESFLDTNEYKKGKKVLVAAASTYVASLASTLLQILRLVLMLSRRRD